MVIYFYRSETLNELYEFYFRKLFIPPNETRSNKGGHGFGIPGLYFIDDTLRPRDAKYYIKISFLGQENFRKPHLISSHLSQFDVTQFEYLTRSNCYYIGDTSEGQEYISSHLYSFNGKALVEMSQTSASQGYIDESTTFDSFHLDSRLLQSIKSNGYKHPTLIQSSSIPLALEEKRDIIAKASTGSGKTLAYLIPVIQTILDYKKMEQNIEGSTLGVILVPTRELAQQVLEVVEKLTIFCSQEVKCLNLSSGNVSGNLLKSLLSEKPEILIATPGKLVELLDQQNISIENLKFLVIDEVDLVLTFGYQDDLAKLAFRILTTKEEFTDISNECNIER